MSSPPPAPASVRHVAEAHRFELTVGDQIVLVDYDRQGGTLVLTHTWVPPELRGQGLAEKVVRAALDHAKNEGLSVVPACSYVARFIERHREYGSLVSAPLSDKASRV